MKVSCKKFVFSCTVGTKGISEGQYSMQPLLCPLCMCQWPYIHLHYERKYERILQSSTLQIVIFFSVLKYRVIKNSPCAWRLQYRKLQVIFKVSPASLQTFINTRLTLTPYVLPNSNYVIMVSDWNCLKYFCVFLCWNNQVHSDFLITLYLFKFCLASKMVNYTTLRQMSIIYVLLCCCIMKGTFNIT
jgi:hypothetical protein